jgi:3,5-epimerase/4-reductase
MRIILYGGHGWIGQMFYSLLKDHEVLISENRVDDVEKVEMEIESYKPTHLLCCMGRTHGTYEGKVYQTIDYLEQPNTLRFNVRDNLFSPVSLAILAQKHKIHMTYIGTGCIFEYDENEPSQFVESSKPNFFGSSYSTVKGFTDQLMHMFPNTVLNLRIRMPITDTMNPRNLITKLVSYKKICSIQNSMTVLPELIPYAIEMMKREMTGTVNLTNPGTIEHNEILEMYREIIDPNHTWESQTLEEQNKTLCSKRSNNHLDTNLLESMFPVTPVKQAMRQMLIHMRDNNL